MRLVYRKFTGAVLLAACVSAFTCTAQAQTMKTVAITAIVEHPALDSARKGIIDELAAEGFVSGKNLKIEFQSAQGNTATAAQIAKKFAGDKPDVIVAISTTSAQSVAAATRTIPIVFNAVTDPVAAKLVKSWKASGTNITGVSDALPLAPQIELMKKVKPGAKRIGFIYSSGEVNSVTIAKELKIELPKHGMSLVEAAAPRTVDISSAAQKLVGKVDLIYSTTDNNVVSSYQSIYKVGVQSKIPLVAADTDTTKKGAAAAFGFNYYDLGRQTGKIVSRILNGEKPGDIAPEHGKKLALALNLKAAKAEGLHLSPELIKSAQIIIK